MLNLNTAKRRVNRKYIRERAYKGVTGKEYRTILDLLFYGKGIREIATMVQREIPAVEAIIGKILANYDEGGKRVSPLRQLLRVKSKHSPHRILTPRERQFFLECWSRGRKEKDISLIMHLAPESVRGLIKEYQLSRSADLNRFF